MVMHTVTQLIRLALTCPFLALGMLPACSQDPAGPNALSEASIVTEGERIVIVDRTGKEWDVTHAKRTYGMEPSKFQFGLGPRAIPPIIGASMLSPGDPNYPDDSDDFLVLGASLNGETKAYPIAKMSIKEVADEKFGDAYVAVAY